MGTRITDKKRPIRMEDLAAAAGLSILDFFISEVANHGSVRAAARANNMRPSAWQYWKKTLGVGVEVRQEVIISPKV